MGASSYYIYQPECEAHIKPELEPSSVLTPKTMPAACYPGTLSKKLTSCSLEVTTRSSFEPFLLSELQASSQVPHSKTEKQDVSCIFVK
ncbi:hypothetical protein DSO57_1008103 [Entomophthora muscae]|uniref:Uncharacterized protein n=1 Tax=Entomophthora muscae TaxID=34485 RepID=A0ACC2RYB0_9FUNG|nr:hypothetical protein DSO57_1008103 [Entomophthora muscae]